jgi:CheY-like chemotaxis protein
MIVARSGRISALSHIRERIAWITRGLSPRLQDRGPELPLPGVLWSTIIAGALPPGVWRLCREWASLPSGHFADAPRPALIVLDLNLPRRTGLEVLADLKADQDLLTIPVLILTTSAAPPDVQRSYSLHASAYIAKPADLDGFTEEAPVELAAQLGEFFTPAGPGSSRRRGSTWLA